MATISKLQVELSLIDRMSRELDKVKKKTNEWGADMRRIGKQATLGLTVPIVTGLGFMVMAASDLNEAITATDAIFSKSAKGIKAWAKTTASSMGIAETDALKAAMIFGGLGKQAGLTGDALNGFSTDLVGAAADLASFFNVDPGTVLEDIQSGLAGQSEPLRKYQIYLTEASVAQKAMEMTGKSNAAQLTENEKVMARAALIMEGLNEAEGDFAKTSKGLANQLRILRARFKDVAAHMGQIMLPTVLKLAEKLGSLTGWIEKLSPGMQKWAVIIAITAAALGPLLIALGLMLPAIKLLLGPLGLVLAAVALLGAAFATNFLGIRDIIDTITSRIDTFVAYLSRAFASGEGIDSLAKQMANWLPISENVARQLLAIADAVGDMVAAFRSGGLSELASVIGEELSNIGDALGGLASQALTVVIDTAVQVAGWFWDNRNDIWAGIKAFYGWEWNTLKDAVTVVIDAAISLAKTVDWEGLKTDVRTGIVNAVGAIVNLGSDIGGKIAEKIKEIPWATVLTADTFNVGVAVGAALRAAISQASTIVSEVGSALGELDWSTVPGKLAEGLKLALLGAGAIIAAIGIAIASFIGGAIAGLIFGPDTDFGAVVALIKTGLQNAINAAEAWTGMLLLKGVDLLQGLYDGAIQKWLEVSTWLSDRPEVAVSAIGGVLTTLLQKGKDIVQGFLDGATLRWTAVTGWLFTRPAAVIHAIGDLAKTLWQKGKDIIAGFRGGAVDKWDTVHSYMRNAPGRVVAAIGDVSRTLWDIGVSIIQGMANGIVSAYHLVTSAVQGAIDLIPGPVKKLLGIGSPSKVMADLLYAVPQGMALGMQRGLSLVSNASAQLAGAAITGTTATYGAMGTIGSVGFGGGTPINLTYNIYQQPGEDGKAFADRMFAHFNREVSLSMGGS